MLTALPAPQDTIDRALVGVCAVVWLMFLGMSVAAIVALVELGTGRHGQAPDDPGTPRLLYAVIAISALIIVGAVPLLLRARRMATAPSGGETASAPRPLNNAGRVGSLPADAAPKELPTEKLRVFGSVADRDDDGPKRLQDRASAKAVDRTWLRVSAATATAMGVAMLFVAIAAYLMAVDSAGTAWVALGFAAVVTVLMPAIPWHFLRALREQIATSA
jgi:hypothetical protein